MTEEVHVTYALTEVLGRLQTDMAANHGQLVGLIAGKADKADVTRLEGALEAHRKETDARLRPLEEERRASLVREQANSAHEGRFLSRRASRWAVLYAVATLLVLALPVLVSALR